MRFCHTNGKDGRYLVAIHYNVFSDYHYYHYYREAKKKFDELKASGDAGHAMKGTALSLYDMVKDVRKEYAKY